jgi:hypothetical protein
LVSLDEPPSSLEPQAVSPRTHTLLATTSLMIVDRLRIESLLTPLVGTLPQSLPRSMPG